MSSEEISTYQYQIEKLFSLLDKEKFVAVYHEYWKVKDIMEVIHISKAFDYVEDCLDITNENVISEVTKHIARYHEFDSDDIKQIANEYRRQDWNLTDQDKEMRDSFIRLCLVMCKLGRYLIVLPEIVINSLTHDDLSILSELRQNTRCKILVCLTNYDAYNKFRKEVELFTFYNMTEQKRTMPLVFIYHHWDEESDKYTHGLQQALEEAGIQYFIDTKDGKNRTKITDMEEKIGDGLIVVPIINDLYLKSIDCMYELALTKENGHIDERLFPLLLCDIDRKGNGLQEQLNYWAQENESYKHEAERLGLGKANIANKEIVRVDLIASDLPKLWEYFKEYLTLSKEVIAANDYKLMINDIKERLSKINDTKVNPRPSSEIPSGNSPIKNYQSGDHAVIINNNTGNITFNQ